MGSYGCGNQPDWSQLLDQWWGSGGSGNYAWFVVPTNAANIIFGANPLYQISDFLAIYPKFGTDNQGILVAAISAGIGAAVIEPSASGLGYEVGDQLQVNQSGANSGLLGVTSVGLNGAITGLSIVEGGTGYSVAPGVMVTGGHGSGALVNITAITPLGGAGYQVNDVVTVIGQDASGGTLTVTAVNGSGAITALSVKTAGTGYQVQAGLLTSGGNGSGLQVSVTQINAFNLIMPQAVLQMYINLASACLSIARWLDFWPMAMALFVAHYATLYLESEGNAGSSAAAIAISGLERGLEVSQSAGDTSIGTQFLTDQLPGFGAWLRTTYGTQLATIAQSIGFGPMYIF